MLLDKMHCEAVPERLKKFQHPMHISRFEQRQDAAKLPVLLRAAFATTVLFQGLQHD